MKLGTGRIDASTAPEEAAAVARPSGALTGTGAAVAFQLELVPYPPGSARSLYLYVNDAWRQLKDPTPEMQAAVQMAFCSCPDVPATHSPNQVFVYYDNSVVVGLVVRTPPT